MTNRTETINKLVAKGLARNDAELVLDLMHHGGNEVLSTIERITLTAPKHLQGLVVFGILTTVQKNSTRTIDAIKEEIKP